MRRLMAALYERIMGASEEAGLSDWRRDLLQDLSGEVLEVGAGTGLNLPHYGLAVRRLVLMEPDRHMRARLSKKPLSRKMEKPLARPGNTRAPKVLSR